MKKVTLLATVAVIAAVTSLAADAPELVVHEWGTFTCLQDENGRAIGGINTDDEPVPDFVHDLTPNLLMPVAPEAPPPVSKGIPRCHVDVTMRLETPVIYFHPRDGFDRQFNVSVSFRRGWLTQFYPDAAIHAFGIKEGHVGSLLLGNSSLGWGPISLNRSDEGPATSAPVWTAPRAVQAATIETKGEHEKYLFYRGVAHLDSPVTITRLGPELTYVKATKDNGEQSARDIREFWQLDVRPNGDAAFRVVQPFEQGPALVAKSPVDFKPEEYGADKISELRDKMRAALIDDGLFEDEAEALLNTWQVSYFKSPGMRVFFLVPQVWTDEVMPLRVSAPLRTAPISAEIKRVMVGRIEIVTPEQRALLARIAHSSSTVSASPKAESADAREARWQNDYAVYLRLGRFRNALVLDEQKQRPALDLGEFINRFLLQAYVPPPESRRWSTWTR